MEQLTNAQNTLLQAIERLKCAMGNLTHGTRACCGIGCESAQCV